MKKRLISLLLIGGVMFCSGAAMVKGLPQFKKPSAAVIDMHKNILADPINVEPESAKKINL